jgi:hypothetical protein
MTFEKFEKLIHDLQTQEEVVHSLYKSNVDLIEFVDPYHGIIHDLILEIYGADGLDWWSWFCHENDYGRGSLEAWDENENPICYNLKSLWEYLEKNKKECTKE